LSEKFESVSRPNRKHFNDLGFLSRNHIRNKTYRGAILGDGIGDIIYALGEELLVKATEAEDH
jgi:hypothetical protein